MDVGTRWTKKIHWIRSKSISGNTKGYFIWHSLTLMFKGLKSTFGSRYLLTYRIIRGFDRSAHSKETDMITGFGIRKEKHVPFREFHPQFQLFVKQNGFPRELKAFKPQMAFIATPSYCALLKLAGIGSLWAGTKYTRTFRWQNMFDRVDYLRQ